MKTKIRTQEYEKGAYGHMTIHILTQRYKDSRILESMGHITFQRNLNEPEVKWYGMRFIIETEKSEYIKKMAKIAEHIAKNKSDWSAQPTEIKHLIGAEEHAFFDSEYIPVSDNGKSLFQVILNGSLYSKIVAANEITAKKIMDKMNMFGAELKFDKQIKF
jgi:hypothetical protein